MGTTEPTVLKALNSGTANDDSGADSLSNMGNQEPVQIVERKSLPAWAWILLGVTFLLWSRI